MGTLTELDEEPSLLLEGCYRVAPDGTLSEYPLHTDQRDVFLTLDLIFTILDPSTALVDQYKSMVS
jgi:hypothetical protein